MQPDRIYSHLSDMLLAARRVGKYTTGLSSAALAADEIRQDALLWQLAIVGEAATRVPPEFRAAHAEIPWRRIVGLRNVLIHQYDRLNLGDIWRVATIEMAILSRQLEALVPPAPED